MDQNIKFNLGLILDFQVAKGTSKFLTVYTLSFNSSSLRDLIQMK